MEGSDKVIHFLAFGLLATGIVRLLPRGRRVWAVVGVSLFGVFDEFHQSFTPGRAVELKDWVADTAGAATAVLLYTRAAPYRRLLETPVRIKRRNVEAVPPDLSPHLP